MHITLLRPVAKRNLFVKLPSNEIRVEAITYKYYMVGFFKENTF